MSRVRYASGSSVPAQHASQYAVTSLEHLCMLDIYSDPVTLRQTSIICTLGPASRSVETLRQLITNGMNVARLNFSHGSHEYHSETIKNVRQVAAEMNKSIAIALDTKGPEIRTGLLKGGGSAEIELKRGEKIKLTSDVSLKESGTEKEIYVDYVKLPDTVATGGTIFVDDGLISLKALEKGANYVICEIMNGGKLGSRKGVNLPHAKVQLPAISEQDRKDLLLGVELDVDMVFASFIRKNSDVQEVKDVLGEKGDHILIISKIENHEGMKNFDEILEISDGIMVARGDLGIEIPPEKVFVAQKMMVGRCNRAGKPVICATQMLDSMVNNPRPTRAEGSDVANAVLDGADCIMLSGETAKGKYPVLAVSMMDRLSREAEAAMFHRRVYEELRQDSTIENSMTRAVAVAAVSAAFEQGAGAILCLSMTGTTAKLLSAYRPRAGILTVTRSARVARQIHLWRGCVSLFYPEEPLKDFQEDVEKRLQWGMERGKERGYLKPGSVVIAVTGCHFGPASTNTIRIVTCP
ncbi:pyruvate kinase PKM-like [Oscarella lobularis]|uniref:pyruvate kinase PKM-like n=1 Tax=Oscarella lobularis TaxID=121494 RepID=UPI003313BA49